MLEDLLKFEDFKFLLYELKPYLKFKSFYSCILLNISLFFITVFYTFQKKILIHKMIMKFILKIEFKKS